MAWPAKVPTTISASAGIAARRIISKIGFPPRSTSGKESRRPDEGKRKERFGGQSGDKVVDQRGL
jgi:hypothetical protein